MSSTVMQPSSIYSKVENFPCACEITETPHNCTAALFIIALTRAVYGPWLRLSNVRQHPPGEPHTPTHPQASLHFFYQHRALGGRVDFKSTLALGSCTWWTPRTSQTSWKSLDSFISLGRNSDEELWGVRMTSEGRRNAVAPFVPFLEKSLTSVFFGNWLLHFLL